MMMHLLISIVASQIWAEPRLHRTYRCRDKVPTDAARFTDASSAEESPLFLVAGTEEGKKEREAADGKIQVRFSLFSSSSTFLPFSKPPSIPCVCLCVPGIEFRAATYLWGIHSGAVAPHILPRLRFIPLPERR